MPGWADWSSALKCCFVNWQSLIMLFVGGVPAVAGHQEGLRAAAARSDRVRLHPGQHPHVGCHAQGRLHPDDL
ncbi:MAG: hypothetical protein MZV70_41535 [Desulfobacterales bacterium]|nr:hypothetical protein [Desulfobacterales bacterium]